MNNPDAPVSSEESHVDRAMLGPTPDNPSLSLKMRLKRARFFDQRDREVAEGKAEPVDVLDHLLRKTPGYCVTGAPGPCLISVPARDPSRSVAICGWRLVRRGLPCHAISAGE